MRKRRVEGAKGRRRGKRKRGNVLCYRDCFLVRSATYVSTLLVRTFCRLCIHSAFELPPIPSQLKTVVGSRRRSATYVSTLIARAHCHVCVHIRRPVVPCRCSAAVTNDAQSGCPGQGAVSACSLTKTEHLLLLEGEQGGRGIHS